MVYDFSVSCKSYEASIYKKPDFEYVNCPRCYATGRFNLHGSYHRHSLYLDCGVLLHKYMKIKRIKCLSCNTTHAVMPGDIIPYKLLSLLALLFILGLIYLNKTPVLKIADIFNISFQFVYSIISVWNKFSPRIFLHFKELLGVNVWLTFDDVVIFSLIRKPYFGFQSGYIKINKRPCFMCKFLNSIKTPPIGQMHVQCSPGSSNITFE